MKTKKTPRLTKGWFWQQEPNGLYSARFNHRDEQLVVSLERRYLTSRTHDEVQIEASPGYASMAPIDVVLAVIQRNFM
jgi:hypothetical protein